MPSWRLGVQRLPVKSVPIYNFPYLHTAGSSVAHFCHNCSMPSPSVFVNHHHYLFFIRRKEQNGMRLHAGGIFTGRGIPHLPFDCLVSEIQ
ncbi:hypothetical protein KKJ13_07850 [Xenorhabdus bovienii]|nr:hypothetical protein [Xenorhabdus bovienii]